MAAQQSDISPHRVLPPTQQGPDVNMGPLTGMATGPGLTLPPLAEQRIPQPLAQMIQAEQKAGAGRNPGIVQRRRG